MEKVVSKKEEIQVWICDVCGANKCILTHSKTDAVTPIKCQHDMYNYDPNWQKTDKYKIVEVEEKQDINKKLTGFEKVIDNFFKSLGTTAEFQFKTLEQIVGEIKPQTPNCAVCEWKREETRSDEDNGNPELYFMCAAQGLQDCNNIDCPCAYNSTECQKLFKQIEPPTPA